MYKKKFIIRDLGIESWNITYKKMYNFNCTRSNNTLDEIWLVEHNPVFTQGKLSKIEDIFFYDHKIPIFNTDRGGKITYHAPGQQILYILINLKKRKIKIRSLISILEKTIINVLLYFGIQPNYSFSKMPGVYVDNKKIASIGIKISKGFTSHGISFNVNMNLLPFSYINPCGLYKLRITQVKNFIPYIKIIIIKKLLIKEFLFLMDNI
ncbi:lipoyl(octanoyl) transferase LipB [Enterobacteriaceae endosymbiont of Donacia bicoloricornis]|uniref:lipoyl(octanoyl) transferase LipB n=1 Tax=Enterobacteriaceae endosymbiont of Donacia bicoloricornis TaxID=2675772 RepID=UPI00144990B3|nr:lipoyl(octanoyl) transferase LipB [Enterobacteriaceae endosymbiont of Donacia bicoloricornis]QJC37612.1 lipoyl(octanoyl) transferase LipB [Enterobacteriaceae endosymbiont of Donacia bicoloricornis]